MHAVVIAVVIVLVRSMDPKQPSHTLPINNLPGIYFESISGVRFKSDTWKTIVNIDLGDTLHDKELYQQQLEDITQECPDDPSSCQLQLTRLSILKRRLAQTNDLRMELDQLVQKLEVNPSVGQATPVLEKHNLSKKGKELEDLMKEAELHHNAAIQHARQTFHTSFKDFYIAALTWCNIMEELLDEHMDFYRKIINVIQSASNHEINRNLITLEMLRQTIQYANRRHRDSAIPMFENYSHANKFCYTTVKRTDRLITINIIFSMYTNTFSQLYQMYGVPVTQDGETHAQINPRKRYIAKQDGSSIHTFLGAEELSTCTFTDNTYFCQPPTISYTSSCEYQLLMDSSTVDLQDCNIQHSTVTSTEWIYL